MSAWAQNKLETLADEYKRFIVLIIQEEIFDPDNRDRAINLA